MASGTAAPPTGVTDDPLVWIDCEVCFLYSLSVLGDFSFLKLWLVVASPSTKVACHMSLKLNPSLILTSS